MTPEVTLLVVVAVVVGLWLLRRLLARHRHDESWLAWAQQRIATAATPRMPLRLRSVVGSAVASMIRMADLTTELSPAAQALVQQCYKDIDPTELFDYHTHLFGTGGSCCEEPSGCQIPPEEDRDLRLHTVSTVMMKCAGVRSESTGDVSVSSLSCVTSLITHRTTLWKC
jgi:hypothetical protein